jgi:unsaturated rhamnogalacturonyl hydrolase
LLGGVPSDLRPSPARIEIEARRARTPMELASLLEPVYGQSFDVPIYIYGMGLIAQLGLGNVEHVEQLVEPYVDGTRDSLEGRFGVSTLVMAGHLVFAELAERTGDPRYLERARAAADLGFDDHGEMLEAMPGHGEMSDAIFMGASILAAVGDLTGERRYFDMAARHIAFMNTLVRRDDGLYRHSPLTDAAWGRGNGFAAIGYALTLSKLPADHPARDRLMREYRELMATLKRWQNDDGTWRQVVDVPGAYHETSSTAIIGFSMQRGLNRGWLAPDEFGPAVERAFEAVSVRTDDSGAFIDVSESTNKQPSLEAYLDREALAGPDQRTGSFAMLFAVEREPARVRE